MWEGYTTAHMTRVRRDDAARDERKRVRPEVAIMPADPFLAIGMVSAPHNFERRRSVRRDMLDLPSIRDGVLVFRFLLGQVTSSERFMFGSLKELHAEVAHQPDVVLLDTLDGSGEQASKQCSCLEKTVEWMQFALVQWPGAYFYAKTEGR